MDVICFLISEFTSGSRLHQSEIHAGDHPGTGHCHGLQVRRGACVCIGRGGTTKQLPLCRSVTWSWYIGSLFVSYSVISMSVLYVLTLHHRGDSSEKDGYALCALWRKRSIFHFSSLVSSSIMTSVPALCSYIPSCVLYITWMPIFTATVTFCPHVCPWYAFSVFLATYFFSDLFFSLICDCLIGCFRLSFPERKRVTYLTLEFISL